MPQLLRDVQHLLSQLAAALDADFEPELREICQYLLFCTNKCVAIYTFVPVVDEDARAGAVGVDGAGAHERCCQQRAPRAIHDPRLCRLKQLRVDHEIARPYERRRGA